MFCEHCGNKTDSLHKFCTKCWCATTGEVKKNSGNVQVPVVSNDRWWIRLLKVSYIFLYIQILWIVPAVWISNSSSYLGYYGGESRYKDTYGEAFWYSILAIAIFMIVIRLIKITLVYIVMGRKPEWKKEFKKLF